MSIGFHHFAGLCVLNLIARDRTDFVTLRSGATKNLSIVASLALNRMGRFLTSFGMTRWDHEIAELKTRTHNP